MNGIYYEIFSEYRIIWLIRSAWDRDSAGSNPAIPTVSVAEMVYAPDCGSGLCGFEPRQAPFVAP